jgi:ubiquinone/menaquinone biosynthesis C-methylase UbiE
MTSSTPERVRQYIHDGTDEDLRRLLTIAEVHADPARAAFRRLGIEQGWSAIDCGCGPIGGLAVLAEMVGPTGRVVGIDVSEPTVQRARSVLATLGLDNVEVIVGDINETNLGVLSGRFDLAYARCFLTHQPDPTHTLTRIAGLVRDGGWIVAQEPLRRPPPRSHPHLVALDASWELLQETVERAGTPPGAIDDLPKFAAAAGLDVVQAGGFFMVMTPPLGFELFAATLIATKQRAVSLGVATAQKVDELVNDLRAAENADHDWVSSPFLLDLSLRKPTAS